MKTTAIIPIWGREALTRLVLEYYASLDIELVCVASTDKDEASIPKGARIVRAPNEPLSDKWNAGAEACRDADVVLVIGSDDLVSENYIRRAEAMIGRGCDVVYPQSMYYFDAITKKTIYTYYARCGTGRMLSRSILERCDFRPWTSGRYYQTDGAMDERLQNVGRGTVGMIPDIRNRDMAIVDVKTRYNLWPMGWVCERDHEIIDGNKLLRDFFPGQAESLLNWQ